jgi:hypothetical protein
MWKVEGGSSALSWSQALGERCSFAAITVMICLFIQPIFLKPSLGAKDTGRNKAQELMPCRGSRFCGETDNQPDE